MTTATKARSTSLALSRDREGWWINFESITPDEPRRGPWPTKADAEEARRSWRRNNIAEQRPCDIKSEWRNRRKLPGAK